jgi:lysophospholipase L1-like esterase
VGFLRGAPIAGAALAVGLLLAPAPTASAATSPTTGLAYVALGDSYAAGFGLTPTTGKPVAGCGQSASDYPHRIAKELGLRLTDATCAGAVTANVISTPQKVGGTSAPPQSRALGPDTRVVTITIGGNDLGFVKTLTSCLALSAHGPILTSGRLSCRASFVTKGVDTLARRVTDTVSGRLAKTFAAITTDAPNAKVFVVGYPAVMPDAANTPSAGCFSGSLGGSLASLDLTNAFPYTDTDVTYLHSIEVDLDSATRAAALHAGFGYTSVLAGSEAHTPCGATPWINGITVHSKNLSFTLEPGALHPNARGEAYLADSVIPQIRRAFPPPTPTSSPSPTPAHPNAAPSLLPWYLSLGLVLAALLGAAGVIIRRRKGGNETPHRPERE